MRFYFNSVNSYAFVQKLFGRATFHVVSVNGRLMEQVFLKRALNETTYSPSV